MRLITDPAFNDVLEKVFLFLLYSNQAVKPVAGANLVQRYFQFFRNRTVPSTNVLIDSHFWDRTVLQAAHHEAAIKHAVLALSSLHQLMSLSNENEAKQQHRSYAERQYQQALADVRTLISSATDKEVDRILIACVIFVVFEAIRGDFRASQIHLESGRSVIIQNRSIMRQRISRRQDLDEICEALFRLDIPALAFQDTTAPSPFGLDDYYQTQPLGNGPQFDTLAEARASLMDLVRWFYVSAPLAIGNEKLEQIAEYTARYRQEAAICERQLRLWHDQFEQLLAAHSGSPGSEPLVCMLKIWYGTTVAMAEADAFAVETKWDDVEHRFIEVVQDCEAILPHLATGDGYSFSAEMGYVPAAFLAASRMRNPILRRRALAVLQALHRQEGLWGSKGAAAVAERWIELEEEGLDHVKQASDIPLHKRCQIEKLFVDVETQSARLWFGFGGEPALYLREEMVRWE
jgi:hypothetical protein